MMKSETLTWARALCIAGLVGFSGTAMAQETAQNEQTETTEAQAEADAGTGSSNIESQLSMGEDADKPSDLGQPYTKVVNGAWEMRCLRTEEPENDPCQMYQIIQDGEGNPVAEFSLFRLPGTGQAKAGATIIVPLETSLTDQLTIRIDGGAAKRYPFAFCNTLGCYARVGLTEADVNAFKRGANAVMTIIPVLAPDQKVNLDLSLTGFTKSYNETSVVQN